MWVPMYPTMLVLFAFAAFEEHVDGYVLYSCTDYKDLH